MKRAMFCGCLLACGAVLAGCATTDRPLQFVSASDPVYPAHAKLARIEGFVRVAYDVAADGTVSNLRVVAAEPEGVFDEAALAAVATWRFRAPIRNGEPVAAPNRASTVTFKLGESSDYAGY